MISKLDIFSNHYFEKSLKRVLGRMPKSSGTTWLKLFYATSDILSTKNIGKDHLETPSQRRNQGLLNVY